MTQTPEFHAEAVKLTQILARQKAAKPGEAAGYKVGIRMVNSQRLNPQSDPKPQLRFTLECIAREVSVAPEDDDQSEMAIEIEDPTARAEVKCLYVVDFTTDRDPDDENVSQEDADALVSECFRFTYPYIRERIRQTSFDVFEEPMVFPLNYEEIIQ